MKISDYIHYYIGSEVLFDNKVNKILGTRVMSNGDVMVAINGNSFWADECKPLLRKLNSMTEEEKTKIGSIAGWYEGKKIINEHHLNIAHDTMKEMAYDALTRANEYDADRLGPAAYFLMVPYLLRQGFDLFGLCDAGLAVDKNEIKG
jgi:hypothetical protein